MSGNAIPSMQRIKVKARDGHRCVRCGGRGAEWHHRRSKSVRDEHRHCTCNGVWLCTGCHQWVHSHPFEARSSGFIVSRHNPLPASEPVMCVLRGQIALDCEGGFGLMERVE